MKKVIPFLLIFAVALCGGCACGPSGADAPEQDISAARELILNGKAECVLIPKTGEMIVRRGGGVSPLMEIFDAHREAMAGGIVVDKVIGRAAAAIAICGKASYVHGEIMSEDAVTFLKENGVKAGWTTLVPRILNRKRDGRCPLELSVDGITDPAAALTALKAKIASFRRKDPAAGR